MIHCHIRCHIERAGDLHEITGHKHDRVGIDDDARRDLPNQGRGFSRDGIPLGHCRLDVSIGLQF